MLSANAMLSDIRMSDNMLLTEEVDLKKLLNKKLFDKFILFNERI
jgi:hypothetical protein